MVRPSYVLGGRAMERIYDARGLEDYFQRVLGGGGPGGGRDESSVVGFPLLVDQFLADAVELDVDVVADRTGAVVVGGVMEHIEEAGIHSGDSACALPPYSLPADIIDEVKRQARVLATELGVIGLMNVQLAVVGGDVFVLEVNPRASRTVPFVSKAIGRPLAKLAAKVMAGRTLAELEADRGRAAPRLGQGGGVPVREVRGRGHAARAGDALDGRGHGHRPGLRAAFMKSCLASGDPAADERHRVPLGARSGQAGGDRDRAPADPPGVPGGGDARHRRGPARGGARRAGHQQGARGAAALRRRAGQPRDPAGHQRDGGRAGDPRLGVAPPRGAHEQRRVPDDAAGGEGGARGDRGGQAGRPAAWRPSSATPRTRPGLYKKIRKRARHSGIPGPEVAPRSAPAGSRAPAPDAGRQTRASGIAGHDSSGLTMPRCQHSGHPSVRYTLGRCRSSRRSAAAGWPRCTWPCSGGRGASRSSSSSRSCHDSLASDPAFVEMLLDEARHAALIRHSNVVEIYDLGEEAGRHFIAMEYLEGEPPRWPASPPRAARASIRSRSRA